MNQLLKEIQDCKICVAHLPSGTNPVLSAHPDSKIAVIGQAPGKTVHASGIAWSDKSGERLRDWLGVDKETFYNPDIFALIPMGFCYPGKGISGDLPPRKECAPMWHGKLFDHLKDIQLMILVGSYAQNYYLQGTKKSTLTETVNSFREYLPDNFPLPHPSPLNNIWLAKNPWFAEQVLPELRQRIESLIG